MKPDTLPAMPPSLGRGTVRRIPRYCIEDAAQEAWAAHLAGADVKAAVWRYVRQIQRRRKRVVCFSQLDPKTFRRIRNRTAAQ